MKYVERVQTSDGKLHVSVADAKRHAENRYGEAVTALAHKLLKVEKYAAACEFVEQAIEAFAELKALRDDLTVEGEEGE